MTLASRSCRGWPLARRRAASQLPGTNRRRGTDMPYAPDHVLRLRSPGSTTEKVSSPRVDISEIGKPGLKIWGGVLREEFLPELTGTRGLRAIQEMREN